jgi:proteasome accessory factor A
MAQKYLARHEAPAWAADVMLRWEETLAALERDPMSLESQLDWVAKLKVLESYKERHGLAWDDPRLHMMDLQYHDVRQDKGIAHVLYRKGQLERLSTDEEITRAVDVPPPDTRAYFRGRCLAQYAGQVAAASWDSVIFDVGSDSLQRIPMHEPLRGTEAMVKDLLDACRSAEELLGRIRG